MGFGPTTRLTGVHPRGRRVGGGGAAAWTPAQLSDLIHYSETRSAENDVQSGAYQSFAALFGSAVSLTAASAGVRPAQSTSELLNGGTIAVFDGVDDWLRNTNAARPTTIAILARQVAWESGFPLVSFGANFPRLRKSGVSNRVEFAATTLTILSQPAATWDDEFFRVVLAEDDGATQYCSLYDAALDEGTVVTDSDVNANARPADGQTLSLAAFVTGTSPSQLEVAAVLCKSGALLTAGEKTSLLDYWRSEIVENGASL